MERALSSLPVNCTTKSEKRRSDVLDTSDGSANKRKKLDHVANMGDKNPVAILNELRVGLKYNIINQAGPSHSPVFTIAVEVDGQKYCGSGKSKKIARCKAAENALKSFIQFPNNCKVIVNNTNNNDTNLDFTTDHFYEHNEISPDTKKAIGNKKPVMLLNELYPGTKFTCVESEDQYSRFTISANVKGEIFSGTGSNKKLAKNAAATLALSKFLSIPPNVTSPLRNAFNNEQQELADMIGRSINEKFVNVMANDPTHAKRKVLAGIVMTFPDEGYEVITVTTGTKCITGDYISMRGAVVNDMHAEIIARRGLMSFFYEQLKLHVVGQGGASIFEPRPEGEGFRLKNGFKFHLYINTAPCGDARIFSPHEEVCVEGTDRHPNRLSRGQLRTKIESGEGTVPVKPGVSQAWDGIIQGERLLTMSCSDKIARWNVLGLQGALLSYFIEPIYLSSLILGSLFHKTHLYRAICGRVENTLQGLPPPFRLNRPSMNLVTSYESRQTTKAPSFAVNWICHLDNEGVEIINTTSGKPEFSSVSRLSKSVFFKKFMDLYTKLPTIVKMDVEATDYSNVKKSVKPYQIAKEQLYDAFHKACLGGWVGKPTEQDQFDYVE